VDWHGYLVEELLLEMARKEEDAHLFVKVHKHVVDFKHKGTIEHTIGVLNTVKDSYHADGTSDMKMANGADPHRAAQEVAANIFADRGILPRSINRGRHILNAIDSTPDGASLRVHYRHKDGKSPGRVFSMRPDGSMRDHGQPRRRKAKNGESFLSPFGVHDRMPKHDR
jgi:hypothetical protein